MAISNFIKGRRYRISSEDLMSLDDWRLVSSYLKIVYTDGTVAEFTGFDIFSRGEQEVSLSSNVSDNYIIYDYFDGDEGFEYLEFVYDYVASGITTCSDNLKAISTLIEDRSLVAIYKESTGTWVNLPCPTDYSGLSTTVVDSARNTKAQVVGQVVATDIAKVELYWNFLTVQQYSNIAKLFEPKHGGHFFVPVSYFDEVTGEFEGDVTVSPNTTTNKIRLMYPGDRKAKVARIRLDNSGKPVGYEGVSLNLIDTGFIFGEEMV